MPSIDHIGGVSTVVDDNGNVGKQTGCKPNTKQEEELYAEDNVLRESVAFRYLLRFDEDMNKDSAMTAMEEALQDALFKSTVEPCDRNEGRIRMRRHLQDDQATGLIPLEERPIALTTLPKDVEGVQTCKDNVQGETCIIVEGGLTMVFPQGYEYNMDNTERDLLAQIKQTMNGETPFWDDDDLKGVIFLGAESIGYAGDEMYVANIENGAQGDNISATGGILIGSAAILLVAGAFGVRTRRQNYKNASRNILDKDLYEMPSEVGDNSTTYEESNPSPRRPLFGNGRLKLPSDAPSPFDDGFVEIHDGNGTGDYGFEICTTQPTPVHIQAQNVHHCTSASCEACMRGMKGSQRNRGIRMIDQSEWYEEDNVDFSDIAFEGMRSAGPRPYDAPDTVSF